MLFAAILLSLASVGMSQAPTPYIDYLSCTWIYAGEGSEVRCQQGFIGIGACGSGTSSDCNTNAVGLQCCRIKGEWMNNQKTKTVGKTMLA